MQNLKSKIQNSKLKALIICLFTFSLLFFSFNKASAATLYVQSAQQDVYEGQTFVVSWYLNTENQSINSVDLKINFSKDVLKAIEASTGDSLVSLWIRNPSLDNTLGTVQLTGGIPSGVTASAVPIFRMTFEAIKSGVANIGVDASSQVLLNDGIGSQAQLKFAPVSFTVQPKDFTPNQISSPTHPDQNHWYTNHNVAVDFSPKPNTDYSFSFSSNIDIIPEDAVAQTNKEFRYPDQPDGVYYFKVNSKARLPAGEAGWAEAGIYRVQIDSTPPEAFVPVIGSDQSILEGQKFVSFSTVDKTSGISHYKVKVGLFGRSLGTQSPYKLYKPLIGDSIIVTAFDQAGNSRQEGIEWPGYISTKLFEWLLILIGLLAIGFSPFIRNKYIK